ncbi:hypothetical protein [Gluconobacter cerinus]|nr:hypothetical protein [Gluconobacter cerinus]
MTYFNKKIHSIVNIITIFLKEKLFIDMLICIKNMNITYNVLESEFEIKLNKDKELNPFTPKFNIEKLDKEYNSLDSISDRDKSLYYFTIWINSNVKKLIYANKGKKINNLSPDSYIIQVSEFFAKSMEMSLSSSNKNIVVSRNVNMNFESGVTVNCQEAIENITDAICVAIRSSVSKSLKKKPPECGSDFIAKDEEIKESINSAIVYRTIYEFWQKVLYGRYNISKEKDAWIIYRNEILSLRECVSQERRISREEGHIVESINSIADNDHGCGVISKLIFPKIGNKGEKEILFEDVDDIYFRYINVERNRIIYACNTWIMGIMKFPFENNNINLSESFSVWLFFRRLTWSNNIDSLGNLISLGGVRINKEILVNAVSFYTGFSEEKSSKIIEVLTYKGEMDRDLWSHPVISIGDDYFLYSISLIFGNFDRVLNQISKINIHNDKYGKIKGDGFEALIRSFVYNSIVTLKGGLSGWSVEKNSLRFSDKREFDLLIYNSNWLIVGEVKCSADPADPYEIADREKLIGDASLQVIEEVKWIKDNWSEFKNKSTLNLPEKISELNITPIIVVDGTYGIGFPVNNVPVVDGRDVIQYLHEKYFVYARENDGKPLGKVRLYNNFRQQMNNFLLFLSNSPLVGMFILNSRKRKNIYRCDEYIDGSIEYIDFYLKRVDKKYTVILSSVIYKLKSMIHMVFPN